jgi:hypothetical protein
MEMSMTILFLGIDRVKNVFALNGVEEQGLRWCAR